jgi:predicted transcriptional regulator
MAENVELITLTADIVAAQVSNNAVSGAEICKLIGSVYGALTGLGDPAPVAEPQKPKGAVSVRASIKPGFLVSMIDGKPYTMLKRHLSQNGHTPQSYREAYGLAPDYPMVAAEYAEKRRAIALSIGLGRKPKVVGGPAPAKRGRKPKIAVEA